LKIPIHESLGPLLRGIGLTLVLLGTVLAAAQTKEKEKPMAQANAAAAMADSGAKPREVSSTNSLQDKSLGELTEEVDELRDTVQEDTAVNNVLINPWFGTLGIIGSAVTAVSFYVEWICKRPKRV
jgi:hypothetical protein